MGPGTRIKPEPPGSSKRKRRVQIRARTITRFEGLGPPFQGSGSFGLRFPGALPRAVTDRAFSPGTPFQHRRCKPSQPLGPLSALSGLGIFWTPISRGATPGCYGSGLQPGDTLPAPWTWVVLPGETLPAPRTWAVLPRVTFPAPKVRPVRAQGSALGKPPSKSRRALKGRTTPRPNESIPSIK